MYKTSIFSVPVEDGDSILVYQTLTSSLIRLEPSVYRSLFEEQRIPNNPQQVEALVSMGFLVDAAEDEFFRLQMMRRRYQHADKGVTGVVIAVTTECNARCFYCYENGIERHSMTDSTADAIVKFLVKNAKTGSLVIQWFGGEPLYAVPTIDRISSGVKAAGITLTGLITTNGFLIDDEILEKAKNDWHIRRFQIPVDALLAPGAHSQFGSGKNTQFEPEQRANPFENVFSKTAVFPPPAIAETDL